MSGTCPYCLHPLELAEDVVPAGGAVRCPNCGASVRRDQLLRGPVAVPAGGTGGLAEPATPASRDAANAAGPVAPAAAAAVAVESAPTVPATAMAALICSLVVVVPVVTQLAALLLGVVALVRSRPRQRLAAAWAGIVLALLGLGAWVGVYAIGRWMQVQVATRPVLPAGPTGSYDYSIDEMDVFALEEEAARVQEAASRYRRDLGEWPDRVETLVGHTLPAGFVLADELTYQPPPAGSDDPAWILLYSTPLPLGLDGAQLSTPKRLVVRVSGVAEMVPVDAVPVVSEDESAPEEPGSVEPGDRP